VSRKARPMRSFKAVGATFQCRKCCQLLPGARMSIKDMLCVSCLEKSFFSPQSMAERRWAQR
jgi:hypothetical protein